uniref:Spermatosis associated 7 n=1 Tax=Gopherus evgoodei TaxID=1825980 RepID=A0A8C4VV03_9SAUR
KASVPFPKTFCIDSSRRLNNQYLIRDHLAFHYNKILSAKVADQQRREKLKKELPAPEGHLSRSLLSSDRQGLDLPNPAKCVRKDTRKISNASISNSSVSVSSPQRKYSGVSYSPSAESVMNISPSYKHQDTESKVYSGDLLDRHSDHFTDSHQPFTPRTLKSHAKSFLSQYRYYTPAKRKRKDPPKQQVEAETQTDLSSFLLCCVTDVSTFKHSDWIFCSLCREEELRYLSFIEDVTDEILNLGLFSNRVLERLFERHIEQNKHRLDENKMRHLLDVLKVDLGCNTEKSERVNGSMEVIDPFDLERFETLDQLQFTSKNWKQNKTTKSEEFLKAMDLLSKETNNLKHPLDSETSKQIHDKDIFSKGITEAVSVGTDPYSSVKSEEAPDISHTFEPTLNSTTCDSDFESNKELDDLEENFAEIYF